MAGYGWRLWARVQLRQLRVLLADGLRRIHHRIRGGAWLVGFLGERGVGNTVWILPVLLAGTALVYVPGLIQLSLFAPDGKTLAWGLYPFIAGDLIKLCVAAMLVPAAWSLAIWLRGDDDDYGGRGSYRERWL